MAAMVEQGGEDQANSGIERRDRSKVEPEVRLRDAVVKAQHGAAQLLISGGRWQGAAQAPQQPLMEEFLSRYAHESATGGVFERRAPETSEGERGRFFAACEDLQKL